MRSNDSGEEAQSIKIAKITEANKRAIQNKSAYILPNNPTEAGFTADEIKGTLYKPIIDEENSVLAEIDRVIDETNNALGTLTRKHSSDIQRIDEKTTKNADSIIKTNQRIDEMHVKWVDLKNISEANKDYVKLIYLKRLGYDFVFRPTEIKDTEIRCEIISPLPDRVEYSTSEGEYKFEHIFSNIDKKSVRIVLGDETNFIYIKADYEIYMWGALYDSRINDECTFYFGANDYNAECICLVGTLESSIITYPLPLSVTDPEESNDYSAVDVRTMNAKLGELSTDITKNINAVKTKLDNVTNVMDFRGAVNELPTDLTNYQDGDVIVVTPTGKEFVLWEGEWIELGDTSAERKDIEELKTGKQDKLPEHPGGSTDRMWVVAPKGFYFKRLSSYSNSGKNTSSGDIGIVTGHNREVKVAEGLISKTDKVYTDYIGKDEPNSLTIVCRDHKGRITVEDGTRAFHAVNKRQLDKALEGVTAKAEAISIDELNNILNKY